jgi:hypothetical protein
MSGLTYFLHLTHKLFLVLKCKYQQYLWFVSILNKEIGEFTVADGLFSGSCLIGVLMVINLIISDN